jgi:hypothetical protein
MLFLFSHEDCLFSALGIDPSGDSTACRSPHPEMRITRDTPEVTDLIANFWEVLLGWYRSLKQHTHRAAIRQFQRIPVAGSTMVLIHLPSRIDSPLFSHLQSFEKMVCEQVSTCHQHNCTQHD